MKHLHFNLSGTFARSTTIWVGLALLFVIGCWGIYAQTGTIQKSSPQYPLDRLNDKALGQQFLRDLNLLLPSIQKTLVGNPQNVALVSVVIDSTAPRGAAKYQLRSVNLDAVGATAGAALTENMLYEMKYGSPPHPLKNGYTFDENVSHVLVFGLTNDQLSVTGYFTPDFRYGIAEAVNSFREGEREMLVSSATMMTVPTKGYEEQRVDQERLDDQRDDARDEKDRRDAEMLTAQRTQQRLDEERLYRQRDEQRRDQERRDRERDARR